MASLQIESGWKAVLDQEAQKPYFQKITDFLRAEMQAGKTFFPPPKQIFLALDLCPWDKVKVVILGQDPYHSAEIIKDKISPHAHGLSFSVPKKNKKIPPSLQNIFKELQSDLGVGKFKIPEHGNLMGWSEQGVLMLNATLTVRAHEANSHSGIGWQKFTDKIIQLISDHKESVVFILWGKFAQSKEPLIDTQKHLILKSPHPSPFSVHSGFFGSKPFSQVNAYLLSQGKEPIDWGCL